VTPRAVRARARALGAALLLAIASGDARAAELYRWLTEDGRVEIGTTPPPGTAAVPWRPGEAEAAEPAPRATPARLSTRAPRARARSDEKCARKQEAARKIEREVVELESEITRLEQRIESLEASEVAFSRTSCVSRDVYGPNSSRCQSDIFHRDTEIANAEQALELAQNKLGDLEQRARGAAPLAECAPASAN
jgi:hypothetical protein